MPVRDEGYTMSTQYDGGTTDQTNTQQFVTHLWTPGRTFWPKRCSVSDEYIPMFTKAYFKNVTSFHGHDTHSIPEVHWMSEKQYVFKKLQGEV